MRRPAPPAPVRKALCVADFEGSDFALSYLVHNERRDHHVEVSPTPIFEEGYLLFVLAPRIGCFDQIVEIAFSPRPP